MENLQEFTFENILLRDDFIASIERTDVNAIAFWDELCRNNSQIKSEYSKASTLYHHFKSHNSILPPAEVKKRIHDHIMLRIESDEVQKTAKRSIRLNSLLKIAALLVVIIGLSLVFSFLIDTTGLFNNEERVYNEITVPAGEKSKVLLSDGTTVWLNSESKLRYPANFEKHNRKVYLQGEGYFDVSKKKNSHFFVFSQNMKIEVLGTVFNVKSYPDDKTIETTVVEGRVKVQLSGKSKIVKEVVLLPTERIVYYKEDAPASREESNNGEKDPDNTSKKDIKPLEPITIQQVNTKNITSWKDHLLVFDNETLENIAVKMARWYRTLVVIEDESLKNERFTGKFVHNETIYQVLKAINLTTPINYEVLNDKVIVKKKKKALLH